MPTHDPLAQAKVKTSWAAQIVDFLLHVLKSLSWVSAIKIKTDSHLMIGGVCGEVGGGARGLGGG